MKLKLGLVVNPLAGIGGAVALKGSDGAKVVAEARRRGAKGQAPERATRALSALQEMRLDIVTWPGAMGEDSVRAAGLDYRLASASSKQAASADTTPNDTHNAVAALQQEGIDLLVFAGGDGTARDILDSLTGRLPVLGIPAGCKRHSGVYANNPEDAGALLRQIASGGLVDLVTAEVRDIDENAFREGVVKARYYGELSVPRSDGLLQCVKCGGQPAEDTSVYDIAACMAERIEDDENSDYLMGSGGTVAEVMQELGLENTLLGVDLLRDGACVASDLTASDILRETGDRPLHAVITVIGGQGHVFGRGNQQLSPDVIRRIGRDNLHIIATRNKLEGLQGRPLQVDTGDAQLDRELSGWIAITTGYEEEVMYPLGNHNEGQSREYS